MELDLRPFQFANRRGRSELVQVIPYMRLHRDGMTVFVQRGHFFWEGGQEIKKVELPAWLPEELARASAEARQEVGLGAKAG